MAQSLLAPIAVRPRPARLAVSLLLAFVVAAASGCGHRRQSMRPVYLSPAPAAAGCPTTVEPSTTLPATSTTVSPSLVDPGATPAAGAPLSTSPPSGLPESPPALTPPVGSGTGPGGEPNTELYPADKGSSAVPPARANPPGTNSGSATPRSSMNSGDDSGSSSSPGARGRRTASGRLRQASLREQVRPFVGDADDLFTPPKADRPWKFVVLHHSASATGGYASIDREHRKRLGWNGCGYHFVIGNGTETPDGQIEVAQRWVEQKHGVHCRDGKTPDVNEYGIGICLVGDLEKSPPTERQVAAARALVAYLCERYQVPAERTETHAHLAASPTSCPGRLFPTRDILGPRGLARLGTQDSSADVADSRR
jgi:N-acetyl-anhydromuramyl-L-alanine amidase AmpD